MKPYVPLGILYLCSHLRAKGFEVEVYDSTFSKKADLLRLLATTPPTVLGVYANLMTRGNVVEILRVAREYGWRTIVGGPEPGSYVAEYLDAGAEVVVHGEGELTVEELLPALRAHADLSGIAGISFRDSAGQLRTTAPRALIRDLDAQPWPARDRVDIDRYVQTWREHHGQGSVSIITARGCPYECRWCSHQVYGKTHRRRSPIAVVDELEFLLERYHPDMAWLADDVFTIHHGWLAQYAAELKRRNLLIPFECISRADRVNESVIATLAEIGCFRLWIGSESGSQRILDAMRRGVTTEQVQRAVELCRSHGIQTGIFLMWGYEGEELQDIEATVEHVKRTNPDLFFTTVSYPIKGTPFYDEVATRVVPGGEWASSTDRLFKIRGRHSRRYYQYADQLLRSEVELERLRRSGDGGDLAGLAARAAEARQGLAAAAAEVEA